MDRVNLKPEQVLNLRECRFRIYSIDSTQCVVQMVINYPYRVNGVTG